jgi:hypothetical protein
LDSEKHTKRDRSDRKGIGLFSYEQERYTTPYQYFAQAAVGTFIAALSLLLLFHEVAALSDESRKYSWDAARLWELIPGLAGIVIGLFMAHAGIIFWMRRIISRTRSARKSRRRNSS